MKQIYRQILLRYNKIFESFCGVKNPVTIVRPKQEAAYNEVKYTVRVKGAAAKWCLQQGINDVFGVSVRAATGQDFRIPWSFSIQSDHEYLLFIRTTEAFNRLFLDLNALKRKGGRGAQDIEKWKAL
ncbi:MAG: hypothetical protein DRO04_00050 [Candidatus Iainarchaeum archaeon]|uniref:Uncharacterized protein n=1 Tax=Candidatus Iainarchaeum sp. TaxID=3101447 RepID=A0A497JIP9_9ARCH|nr:MAG: hypothetical protein DRO04_00050 [Candidatus Diapherotrites archaeon]